MKIKINNYSYNFKIFEKNIVSISSQLNLKGSDVANIIEKGIIICSLKLSDIFNYFCYE